MLIMRQDLLTWINDNLTRRDWSQRKLARSAGLSHSSVSNVLNGKTLPTFDFCASVAQAFGEKPEAVFRLAGLLPSSAGRYADLSEDERRLIDAYRGLDEQRREAVTTLALGLLVSFESRSSGGGL